VEPDSEGAFTAGLLHDLGKVVLVAFFPDAAATVFELMTREDLSWRQAELRLDLDHQDVGLYLAEHWNLPPMLGEVMGRHHAPDPKLHYEPLVLLVHLADWVVHQLQEGLEGASRMPELLPEASARLGLTPADMTRCQESLLARADSLDQLWQSFQN
jgi:HD-like signal output (HDOD) protein